MSAAWRVGRTHKSMLIATMARRPLHLCTLDVQDYGTMKLLASRPPTSRTSNSIQVEMSEKSLYFRFIPARTGVLHDCLPKRPENDVHSDLWKNFFGTTLHYRDVVTVLVPNRRIAG